ncbi:MAG: hypothetical protein QHH06_04005 [Clostridiales bacterium]|jgi:hypothetical protein|nr:hypothetical protein [Eubacteriales bacterium]MDH7565630.1 hypothetical protein [Clostridiales bacterium]
MAFKGNILKNESYDPHYRIEFSYETEEVSIEKGYAEIIRRAPRPIITYDSDTESRLGPFDRAKLELELLNLVINFWFQRQKDRTI